MRRDVSGRRRALGFPNMGNEPHKTAELLNITKLKELLEKTRDVMGRASRAASSLLPSDAVTNDVS